MPPADPFLAAAGAALGGAPEFVVRAPGRVNLIGEHTDYNGLPVLPMAIDRSVMIAGRRRDDGLVRLRNAGPFPERRFRIEHEIPPFASGDWGNYPKAAAQGLFRHLPDGLRHGADLFVAGDIPDGAGLSSSAALVVASALALLAADGRAVAPEELAELLPRAEQYVGTLSGGMDQTICLLAQAGHALRIDFRPLRYRSVPLPSGYAFVVAHSLVHADKAVGARRAYNLRVAECRLASRALARILDLAGAPLRSAHAAQSDRLAHVRPSEFLGDIVAANPQLSAVDLTAKLAAALPEGPLPLAAIALRLDADPQQLRRDLAIPDEVGDAFTLIGRARHVLSEAERVNAAESALHAGDVERFAAQLRDSHASCRDNYEISCAELEELVGCAASAGALAARLTGAGFGGCIVALVPAARADDFLTRLDACFYRPRNVAPGRLPHVRFVLSASSGATVTRL